MHTDFIFITSPCKPCLENVFWCKKTSIKFSDTVKATCPLANASNVESQSQWISLSAAFFPTIYCTQSCLCYELNVLSAADSAGGHSGYEFWEKKNNLSASKRLKSLLLDFLSFHFLECGWILITSHKCNWMYCFWSIIRMSCLT